MSAATVSLSILAAVVVLFVGTASGGARRGRGRARALLRRGAHLGRVAGWFRRSGRDPDRGPFRRQRGTRCHWRDHVAGPYAGREVRRELRAPARFHHVAQRGPHRADRAERNGGCAAAHGGDGRRAARLPDVAVAHAARLRRQRGRATAPDRKPGERSHLGGRR